MIPIYSIKVGPLEKKYINDCLNTGWISSAGKYVEKFESAFAQYLGVKFALTTTSGTTALHLMLASAGLGPNDEVIIPDYTFVSTALAVSYLDAKPVFVDIDKKTWNINVEKIEEKITSKTKAIIPVDIYGVPTDMSAIKRIAKKYNLIILEDAAEALGAKINGKKVGSEADGAIFSFYGNKTITTGEGGMLVTNSKRIYERAKCLKEYGRDSKNRYISIMVGFNYRMTNMQAALGLGQLKRIETILKRKAEILNLYKQHLKTIPGIIFQEIPGGFIPSAWLISIVINKKLFGLSKDELASKLHQKDVDTRGFFPPLHRQPIYKQSGQFPIADYLSQNGLSLPSYPTLKNSEIKYICNVIKESSK